MIATSIIPYPASAYSNWVKNFYGVANDVTTGDDTFVTNTPRHQFGVPWVCQYYFMPVTQTSDPTKSGWEDLQKYLEEIKVDGPAGIIASMEYHPNVGIVKQPVNSIWTGLPSAIPPLGPTIRVNSGAGNSEARRNNVFITNGKISGTTEDSYEWVTPDIKFDMLQMIEKSQNIYQGITPQYKPSTQPTLHVGVMPVPALTTKAISNTVNNSSFTDTQAYYEVVCEAEIECAYPTKRPLATTQNVSMEAVVFQTKSKENTNYSSQAKIYHCNGNAALAKRGSGKWA